jgi:tetratricopeptide (TPR) repeat protein
MSLIFQSLQKLDANLNADHSGNGDSATEQEHRTSRFVRGLLPVLIGPALILALGCGAVYAVQYLKQRMPENVDHPAVQDKESEGPLPISFHPIEPAPKPAGEKTYKSISTATRPAEENQTAPQYQYHPPDPGKDSTTDQPLAMVDKKFSIALKKTENPSSISSPLNMADSEVVHTKPAFDAPEPVSAPAAVNPEMEAAEQARRVAMEKSAYIGRLVQKIERALGGAPGAEDPHALIKKLARIKGEHHPYVAKLRAYWNFKRGKYDLAESELHKVIAANPEDLEAGINLALIEIHYQRCKEAMVRLKKLREIYPENARIADLIKRLR